MKKVVHAACPHDCPDACGVLITVEDGKAIKVQGDPKHPVTRGFLCAKVAKYLDRVYSPDRVLYPMRRKAAKGPRPEATGLQETFQRISWDEALDEIAARFRAIARQYGPEAILPYSYGGSLGALNNASMDRRFFHRLGASQLDRTICSAPGTEGIKSVLGIKLGTEPEQFAHSKYIIAWGANIHGNNVHLWPFIEEARRKGAKFVVIDPYKTRTARCADWYLPINPGTDVALALGLMHVIIGERLYDADYVSRYTLGFEALRERVKEYPPERVAQWTGISAEDIMKLAREYATVRPAAIRLNYGVQRCDNGGMAMRTICMLPCVTGSWKEIGGGLQVSTGGAYTFDKNHLERPDLMQQALGRPARVVNMIEIGKALNSFSDPPIQAVLVYNSNPVAVAPNHHEVVRGFARPDLFTVVHEQFFTDTCDYADIVLPATTFFEHKDLQGSYGNYFVQVSQPAIEARGEARSNFDFFSQLAIRMGFPEDCFRETVDAAIEGALDSGHAYVEGIDRRRLEREGPVRLNLPRTADTNHFLPFAQGGFATPSGKAELYSEAMITKGLDAVAAFVPSPESRHVAEARRYPLELLARKADNFLNSTFTNQPGLQSLEERGLLEMCQADAERRGIRDGDSVRVFNRRGELHLTARVNGSVRPGVVAGRLDWAKLSPEGKNINVLIADRVSDLGNGPVFYSALVEVERAEPGAAR